MRRLTLLLLPIFALATASFAAAEGDDIIVTAQTHHENNYFDYGRGGGGFGGFGDGGAWGGEGGGGAWGGGGSGYTPITITTSTSNSTTIIEATWPVTVTVAGRTYETTRTIRCTCNQLTIDLQNLP